MAKRFGVKVEEFGIGYPPRLFGKKIGETIYSINLLPFGAFIRLPGEIGEHEDPRSFSKQSITKRVLIILGGVIAFWIIAAILFSFVFSIGAPTVIGDEDVNNLINPRIQIAGLSPNSPAETAGLVVGDTIRKISFETDKLSPIKIKEIQEFTNIYLGKEIILTVERGDKIFDVSLTPRVSPPKEEGPMGVALIRTAIKKYPWYSAPWQGILATLSLTFNIILGYGRAIWNLFNGTPTGVQLTGPIGVFQMLSQAQELGISYFINFLGMISIYLAVFNILPIPAVDGGRLLFLGIEAVRKKPIPEKVEQNITVAFFMLLLVLMVLVTINDINRLF
ncbi:MAG: RIP metalloprotease RseP [Patescibacteria group bacterium]|nr:RIP metalloprotease RseP [Patescibacteria group bacterium]